MARKTIPVTDLIDMANAMLSVPDAPGIVDDMWREGVMALLERALHATDNYRGFRYQASEKVEEPPFAPGTMYLRPGYNDTRRLYYHPPA